MAVLLTSKDFCQLLDDTITDETFFNTYFDIGDEVKTYLSPCLYGSGDLATQLGITTQLDQLDELGSSLEVGDLPDFPANSVTIAAYQDFITAKLEEKLSDGAPFDL